MKHQKNYQSQKFANTWQKTLQNKEVLRNNYQVTGDIKKAKMFVKIVNEYSPHTHGPKHEERIIFPVMNLN